MTLQFWLYILTDSLVSIFICGMADKQHLKETVTRFNCLYLFILVVSKPPLIHISLAKMAAVLQMVFSDAFS